MTARSIKIFLVDGSASGLRTAELGLSTIKAVVVPRVSLSTVMNRPEPKKTGVYVLIGPDSDKLGTKKIYIGEGDMIINRLNSHNKDEGKDFWEEAVIFVSKDENLTKSHVRYLEARMISLVRDAKRATVANGTTPPEQGKLPEADEIEMEEFISQAKLLLGTLGYDLFEPASTPTKARQEGISTHPPEKFIYAGDKFKAECILDLEAGRFIVKSGSTAKLTEAPSIATTYKNLRTQLISSGVLIKKENAYEFSQDYSFSSITAAAQVVGGKSINGRSAWKTVGGKLFSDWQDAQTPIEEQR